MRCKYRPSLSREASTASPARVGSSTSSPPDAAIPQPSVPVLDDGANPDLILDTIQLRLLHHYTTVTAKTLAHNPASEEVYAINLVQTAFDYPFLLHAVLALGALHLSRTDKSDSTPSAEYSVLADRHHNAALYSFRAAVNDIDRTNWKAVLMFAGLLFPYSCTAFVSASNNLEHAFDNFLSNLLLTRRVRPMVISFFDEFENSELGRIVPDDVKGVDWMGAEAPTTTEYVPLRDASVDDHVRRPLQALQYASKFRKPFLILQKRKIAD
jgi:hypothetical protein